jgi:hypothetical protein
MGAREVENFFPRQATCNWLLELVPFEGIAGGHV